MSHWHTGLSPSERKRCDEAMERMIAQSVPYRQICKAFGCSTTYLTDLKIRKGILTEKERKRRDKADAEEGVTPVDRLTHQLLPETGPSEDLVEGMLDSHRSKAAVDETLDTLLEGVGAVGEAGNTGHIRYQTAAMALNAARTALISRPADADVAQKTAQVIRICTPILEAAEKYTPISVEKVMELWNS